MTPKQREKQSLIDSYYREGQNETNKKFNILREDVMSFGELNVSEGIECEQEMNDWNNVSTDVQGLGDSNLSFSS